MRPQRQGDLDGLCGLYAVVNAIELTGVVGPKALLHRRLFNGMLEGLSEGELHHAMVHGLSRDQLIDVSSYAFRRLRRRYDLKLQIEAAAADWPLGDFDGFIELLHRLSVQPKTAVIIDLVMPRLDHWTVVRRVRLGRLDLRDSEDFRSVALDRFALRGSPYRIEARCTLVVRRLGGPDRLRACDLD